jgi:hypothetical protein
VAVETPVCEAGALHNVHYTDAVKSLFSEKPAGSVQNQLTVVGHLLAGHLHTIHVAKAVTKLLTLMMMIDMNQIRIRGLIKSQDTGRLAPRRDVDPCTTCNSIFREAE